MNTDQAAPAPTAPRQKVGIRELKQNPSEIIARAAMGEQFDVLSNGKAVGVVIQRDTTVRSRFVSTASLTAMSRLAGASTGDSTATREASADWARELREARELENDPIIDPWDEADRRGAEQVNERVAAAIGEVIKAAAQEAGAQDAAEE